MATISGHFIFGGTMELDYIEKDVIVALATPPGSGSISVIRVSGRKSLEIVRSCCQFLSNDLETNRVYYGIFHEVKKPKNPIDEVLVSYFKEGKSFSGEETLEVSCHGNPYIVEKIIMALIKAGARVARKGEFTFRAFMNGRIDLAQAESVLSIIQSESDKASQQALDQLGGKMSEQINELEDKIIYCLAHIEASIDFSTEGLDTLDVEQLLRELVNIRDVLGKFVNSYKHGKIIKDGFKLVLTGEPNVGKSSLLNAITGENRAIVTQVPGTTRDVVDISFLLGGYKVVLLDTAGIRKTSDLVESIGIQKTWDSFSQADGICLVLDLSSKFELDSDLKVNLKTIKSNQKLVVFLNKADLFSGDIALFSEDLISFFKNEIGRTPNFVFIGSSFNHSDIESFKNQFLDLILKENSINEALISNNRHFECLSLAFDLVSEALNELKRGQGAEFLSIPLREALLKVQEVVGKHYDDQILDRVFKEFCLGK